MRRPHSVAARALILREIPLDLSCSGTLPRENAQSARDLRIQLLVLRILHQHPFRVLTNAAPLKQEVVDHVIAVPFRVQKNAAPLKLPLFDFIVPFEIPFRVFMNAAPLKLESHTVMLLVPHLLPRSKGRTI